MNLHSFKFSLAFSLATIVLAAFLPTVVQAQHGGDVVLRVESNKIITGRVLDGGGGSIFEPARIFSAELGEIIPNEVDEPGFDSLPNTFSTPSNISFNIMDVLGRWNSGAFEPASPTTMSIRFGGALGPVTTPAVRSFVEGFSLPVAGDGAWHRHYDFMLNSPASEGVYLLKLNLQSDDPNTEPSDPFWIVFNQNDSPANHAAAIHFAETTLVPEPSTMTLGGVAIVILCLVSRRRSLAARTRN